jgi:uncharacterized protein
MSERLPVHVDPVTLADRGREMAGTVPVSAFRRFSHWLASTEGEFTVELQFGRDEQRRRVVTGRIRGQPLLACQRCLTHFGFDLDLPIGLVLVESEAEADTLPDEVDAVVMSESASMHTVDMIEDDLILALPLVPKCPDEAACTPGVELFDSDEIDQHGDGRQRPFADLDASDPDEPDHS